VIRNVLAACPLELTSEYWAVGWILITGGVGDKHADGPAGGVRDRRQKEVVAIDTTYQY